MTAFTYTNSNRSTYRALSLNDENKTLVDLYLITDSDADKLQSFKFYEYPKCVVGSINCILEFEDQQEKEEALERLQMTENEFDTMFYIATNLKWITKVDNE